jgi:hypothetical protein
MDIEQNDINGSSTGGMAMEEDNENNNGVNEDEN